MSPSVKSNHDFMKGSQAMALALALLGLLLIPHTGEGQVRYGQQGASGLMSIPPLPRPTPLEHAWGYNPSWYYGIRHPPGYTGYYPGYYSYSGYTSPSEARDYPRYYRSLMEFSPPPASPEARFRAPSLLPPAAPLQAGNRVTVKVRVAPDAQVWFEGALTNQTGAVRQFVSPPLSPGHEYSYTIRARWMEAGSVLERTRQLRVWAGSQYLVDFTWLGNDPAR